jgi:Holliday junction resolvase RusA-like endonuclease
VSALLSVTIHGSPIGKGRARTVTRGKGGALLPFARTFTPKKTENWEASAVSLLVNAWAGRAPIDEPVGLVVRAVGPRTKTLTPKPRALAKEPALGRRLWRVTKPDGDNVAKIVGDALVKAGVVRDDTRIARWVLDCLVADVAEGPRVEIQIVTLPAWPDATPGWVEVACG